MSRAAPLRRVGHKGADLIAPGNTRASFDAALEAGVDMIEFDVLPVEWPLGEAPGDLQDVHLSGPGAADSRRCRVAW